MPGMTSVAPTALPTEEAAALFGDMQARFAEAEQGIEVDFRALVPNAAATERATHMVHPYPAKLLRHIPAFVVSVPQICPPGCFVLDPFCGSGTTLVEVYLAGGSGLGVDINPLAALISNVKTTPLDVESASTVLAEVLDRAKGRRASGFKASRRLEYWYPPRTLAGLSRLRDSVQEVDDVAMRNALSVALSATARDLSLANPRVSVPVRLRPELYPASTPLRDKLSARLKRVQTADVAGAFADCAERTIRRIGTLTPLRQGQSVAAVAADARSLKGGGETGAHVSAEVDLILTSPPYLGAQKYIRATSLNLLCLELASAEELGDLQRESIGREHFRKKEYADPVRTGVAAADELIEACRQVNPLRAHLAGQYLNEMNEALTAAEAVLRVGGAFVLVAGGNQLCGFDFDTPAYLRTLCERAGLRLEVQLIDSIRSRGLMTRRNREASPIATECVMVFRK